MSIAGLCPPPFHATPNSRQFMTFSDIETCIGAPLQQNTLIFRCMVAICHQQSNNCMHKDGKFRQKCCFCYTLEYQMNYFTNRPVEEKKFSPLDVGKKPVVSRKKICKANLKYFFGNQGTLDKFPRVSHLIFSLLRSNFE